MSDDIVTRLRATTTIRGFYDYSTPVVFKNNPLCYEAADEIERLRKIIRDVKAMEMCDPNDPCEMCKEANS